MWIFHFERVFEVKNTVDVGKKGIDYLPFLIVVTACKSAVVDYF